MALFFTLVLFLLALLLLLLALLFGTGWPLYVCFGIYFIGFIITNAFYRRIDISQEELDEYNRQYGVKTDRNGNVQQTANAISDPRSIRGISRMNVSFIAAGQKMIGLAGFLVFVLAVVLFAGNIATFATGTGGFALNLDGVYVQSTASHSGNGVSQVGKTAFKIDGDYIYYSGYYDGANTGWGKGYVYHRTGSHVTYTFTGGGMNSTHDLYFVNFGNNISSDKFGFDIQFTKTSAK